MCRFNANSSLLWIRYSSILRWILVWRSCNQKSHTPTSPPNQWPGSKGFTQAAAAKSLQSCLTVCEPVDSSPPGSPIPGILQARTLEWVAISFSNAWKWKVKVKSLSCVQLFGTPWTAAHQAPLSMGFSRQEYWSRMPLPSPLLKLLSMNQGLYWGNLVPELFSPCLSPFIWSPAHSGLHHRLAKLVLTLCSQDIWIVSFLWSCSPSRSSESASPLCSNMLRALEGGGTVRAMALLSCPGHGARRAPCGPCLLPAQMKGQGLRSELHMGFDHGGQVTVSHSLSSMVAVTSEDLWRDPQGGSTLLLSLLAGLHPLGSGIVLVISQGSRGREGDEGSARHGHLLQEAPALVLRPDRCRCFCSWHFCFWSAFICWASSIFWCKMASKIVSLIREPWCWGRGMAAESGGCSHNPAPYPGPV